MQTGERVPEVDKREAQESSTANTRKLRQEYNKLTLVGKRTASSAPSIDSMMAEVFYGILREDYSKVEGGVQRLTVVGMRTASSAPSIYSMMAEVL